MNTSQIGSAIVYTGEHSDRIVEIIGEGAFGVDPDFASIAIASNAPSGWTTTLVGTSTLTRADAVGGAIVLTTGASENDGVNTQIGGEAYKPSATASLYFYTKLAVSEAEQSDLFIGLTITDTAVLTNLGKRIGFRSVDGSAALGFEYEGTAETTIEGVHTLVNDTEVELEFFWDHVNSQVRVYIDGTLKGTYTPGANLPDTEIKPSVNFLTGAGSAETCTIRRLKVVQTSGR